MERVPSSYLGSNQEGDEAAVVLDGRNIYDGDELQEMGFVYHCIGR